MSPTVTLLPSVTVSSDKQYANAPSPIVVPSAICKSLMPVFANANAPIEVTLERSGVSAMDVPKNA